MAWSIDGDASTGPAVGADLFVPALAEQIVGLADERLAGGAIHLNLAVPHRYPTSIGIRLGQGSECPKSTRCLNP